MATEEVKIFFKVEGLDGYITDLDDLKSALGGVTAETKQATTATEQLSKESIDSAEKFERRIQTLEGGVKVLAGSAEFAAGAIGLLGEENSEFFKEVEGNVLNVVALAQGAIDFSEGLTILSKNTKLATIAQRAFNTVAKANPYVLLASALIAAGGALALYIVGTREDTIETRANYDIKKDLLDVENQLKNLRAETASRAREYADLDAANRKLVIDDLERQNESANNTIDLLEEQRSQLLRTTGGIVFMSQAQKDQYNQGQVRIFQLREEIKNNDTLVTSINQITKAREDEAEANRRAGIEDIETLDAVQVKTIEVADTNKELMVSTANVADGIVEETIGLTANQVDNITNFTDVAEDTLGNFATNTEQIFSTLGDLNTLFTKDDEKRQKKAFDINKAASLSQAIIAGALAVNKAFTSQLIPGDPTSLPRAIGASIIAGLSSAAQIATIARQQFNSPTPGSVGGGGGATLNYQVGGQEAGANVTGQFSGGAGGTGGVSQTYVLAGDVTSQQQAEAQIQNLARL